MPHRLHAAFLHELPHVLGHHLGRPRLFASILKVFMLHDEHIFLEFKVEGAADRHYFSSMGSAGAMRDSTTRKEDAS